MRRYSIRCDGFDVSHLRGGFSFSAYEAGTKWAADIFAEGNAANQSKGSVGTSYGSGWIIEPNQEILLEIESLEAAQNISARLEMYNGLLDLPL